MATKTEELLEKSIAVYLVVDQYADSYYDDVLSLYRRAIKRISRILKPEYGTKLSVKQKAAVKADIAEEIMDYKKALENAAQKELTAAVEVFYEQEEKLIYGVAPDVILADRPDLTRGLFSTYHATDKGGVIQLAAMYSSHINLLLSDTEDVVNRMGAVADDKDVAQGYFAAATNRNQNILNAVALTSILFASSRMRQLFYSRNKRLFDGYQWVSILDSKTTDYCQFRHLKVWYYNDQKASTLPAEEHPPGHFRCRSRTIPLLSGETPVQSPTFEEWFANQESGLQRQVLGATRYQMYINGTLDIGDLNNIRGERRTLAELKAFL